MEVSVVIPLYNRREDVLRLLGDLSRQEGVGFEVVVVDDGSTDGSPDAVREAFPEVRLFVNERNGGPCVSRNRGVREARGEFIVGLDSDVSVPDPGLLRRVVGRFAGNADITGLAFRILKPDGISEDIGRWWHPVPVGRFAGREFLTSYFSGTGYAFRRQAMIDAGLYPEPLYMHYEEVELAFRVLDNGGRILHCPDLKVLHHEGVAKGRNKVQTYYKPRNQILIALSCLPTGRALAYLVPRAAFQLLRAGWNRHLGSYFRAMIDGLKQGCGQRGDRKPLKAETLATIRSLRRGIAP